MKLNRRAVAGICADAWGMTPAEFRERMRRREIAVADVATRVRLELCRNPLAAQYMINWLLPGADVVKKRNKHQADMLESFRRAARQKGRKE